MCAHVAVCCVASLRYCFAFTQGIPYAWIVTVYFEAWALVKLDAVPQPDAVLLRYSYERA
jgi:hypothetical protein